MTIVKTFRADVVAGVPDRWTERYRHYGSQRQFEIGARLKALPAGFTAEQVDEIIGNTTWTAHLCDECGENFDELVRVGEGPDYGGRDVSLCADCLADAAAVLSGRTDTRAPRREPFDGYEDGDPDGLA